MSLHDFPVDACGVSSPLDQVRRYMVRPREDGHGPYRWCHVVKARNGKGLRQGNIYRTRGDDLNTNEVSRLIGMCDRAGFEMRRVA